MVTPTEANDAKALIHASIHDFEAGAFEKALQEAEDAYRLDPLPQILFNIGQCQRALKHWKEAVFFYGSYLTKVPEAPNRSQVEDLVTEAEYRLEHPEVAPAKPLGLIPSTPATAEPVQPNATARVPPEALERPAQPPRSHAAAYTLGAVAAVGLAVMVVGIVEVESFESLVGSLQKPTGYAAWQVQQTNAVAQLPQAQAWQWAAWVSGAVAVGTGTAAVFTW
jgi:tetratricopeptide (TPR) repeat protein